jgi:hypothetical protein
VPNIDRIDFYMMHHEQYPISSLPWDFQLSIGRASVEGDVNSGGYIEGSTIAQFQTNFADSVLECVDGWNHKIWRMSFYCGGLYLPYLRDFGNMPYCYMLEMLSTPPQPDEIEYPDSAGHYWPACWLVFFHYDWSQPVTETHWSEVPPQYPRGWANQYPNDTWSAIYYMYYPEQGVYYKVDNDWTHQPNRCFWLEPYDALPNGLLLKKLMWASTGPGSVAYFSRPDALKMAFCFANFPEGGEPPPPPPPIAGLDLPQII